MPTWVALVIPPRRAAVRPLKAAQTALDVGVRDVRNQSVLMRGVNATTADLLELRFVLRGETSRGRRRIWPPSVQKAVSFHRDR